MIICLTIIIPLEIVLFQTIILLATIHHIIVEYRTHQGRALIQRVFCDHHADLSKDATWVGEYELEF